MDASELAARYVALWNESDPERRQREIAGLWAENGAIFTATTEAHGHRALAARVADSHDRWVRDRGMVFRYLGNASGHNNAVRFNWDMAPAAGGDPISIGFDFFVLDERGRIVDDYQFIESP